jgi:hypothetical protein
MYLIKNLEQIHSTLLTTFCLYFGTERVYNSIATEILDCYFADFIPILKYNIFEYPSYFEI